MLFDEIKYNWLITIVPHISFLSEYDWKYYLNTLKQCKRMYFRMNINRIEQSKSMIEDDFDNYAPETEEFEHLLIIHSRLIQLLLLIKNTI